MSVTQTVTIPADRRLVIDVPREVPVGRTVLAFTPAPEKKPADIRSDCAVASETGAADDSWFERGEECPFCAAHRDPVTGEELFNAKTIAAIEEGDAIMRGEIPAKRYSSLADLLAALDAEDD